MSRLTSLGYACMKIEAVMTCIKGIDVADWALVLVGICLLCWSCVLPMIFPEEPQ